MGPPVAAWKGFCTVSRSEAVAAWHGSLIMTLFAITFTIIAIILIALFNLGVEPPL